MLDFCEPFQELIFLNAVAFRIRAVWGRRHWGVWGKRFSAVIVWTSSRDCFLSPGIQFRDSPDNCATEGDGTRKKNFSILRRHSLPPLGFAFFPLLPLRVEAKGNHRFFFLFYFSSIFFHVPFCSRSANGATDETESVSEVSSLTRNNVRSSKEKSKLKKGRKKKKKKRNRGNSWEIFPLPYFPSPYLPTTFGIRAHRDLLL